MAVYFWIGPEPDVVFVVNKHRIRMEHRENYEEPEARLLSRRSGGFYGVWQEAPYRQLTDGNH